jgi:hypothetical protein
LDKLKNANKLKINKLKADNNNFNQIMSKNLEIIKNQEININTNNEKIV